MKKPYGLLCGLFGLRKVARRGIDVGGEAAVLISSIFIRHQLLLINVISAAGFGGFQTGQKILSALEPRLSGKVMYCTYKYTIGLNHF